MHGYIFKGRHASLLPLVFLRLFLSFFLSFASFVRVVSVNRFPASTISWAKKQPVDQPFTSTGDFKFYLTHSVHLSLSYSPVCVQLLSSNTKNRNFLTRLFSIGYHRLSNDPWIRVVFLGKIVSQSGISEEKIILVSCICINISSFASCLLAE